MRKLKLALYMIEGCEGCEISKALTGRKISNLVEYAPNISISEVICHDQVEPVLIQKALQAGAEGVLILGCNPEQCQHTESNIKAGQQTPLLKDLLAQMGSEEDRALDPLNLTLAGGATWESLN